ncbi:MAG: hypothetical protein P1V81_15405 [Planctomycetota bacterium]|nr:hypothetical protein [Planctomycetota bacterium]
MRLRNTTPLLFPLLFASLAPEAAAQGSAFSSPGMPNATGQTTRFDNEYNPAIGFSFDALLASFNADHSDEDGLEIDLRSAEMSLASWVDPTAWAYATIVFDGEETSLEEGAVHYTGLGGNTTIRAGRFFVDFGKQMQAHVHDLRTIDRPAVLRTYLGAELGGDGIQFDNWHAIGDDTIVRYSIGAFGSLITHAHGDEHDHGGGGHAEAEVEGAYRPELDELSLTARLTGFTSLSDTQTLQLGTSLRSIPEFAFHDEENDLEVEGQDNMVWGLDATWGWVDDTQTSSLTIGGEYLLSSGALSAEVDDPDATPGTGDESLEILDEDAAGFYAFIDYGLDPYNSVGLQFSQVETLEDGLPELEELDLYWTHSLSEFQRVRLALTQSELEGEEVLRLGLQYTIYLGPHAHGVNF